MTIQFDEKYAEAAVFGLMPQQQANYQPFSPDKKMCGTCFFYMGEGNCRIVENYPLMITAVGRSDFYTDARTVLNKMPGMDEYMPNKAIKRSIIQKWLHGETPPPLDSETFGTFKALGDGTWIACYTNNFEDLEGEIISKDAHLRYLARLKAGDVDYPELWVYHLKGTRIGQATHIDYYGDHMMIAIGTFDDTPHAKEAEKSYQGLEDLELSHGFWYPSWAFKEGVYDDYTTYEITVLPPGAAANPYTSYEVIKEMNMQIISPERLAFLKTSFPSTYQKMVDTITGNAKNGEKLAEIGARYKSASNFTAPTPTAPAQTAEEKDALGDVLSMLLEGQNEMQEVIVAQEGVIKTLTEGLAKEKARNDELEKVVKEVATNATKALDSMKQIQGLTPRSVQNATAQDSSAIPDGDEARKAAERIREQAGEKSEDDKDADFLNGKS